MPHTKSEDILTEDQELKQLVKSLFDDFLDYEETHGFDEHALRPVRITCCRVLMGEKLSKLLVRMKELSHK